MLLNDNIIVHSNNGNKTTSVLSAVLFLVCCSARPATQNQNITRKTRNNPRNRQSQQTTIQPTQLTVLRPPFWILEPLAEQNLNPLIAQTFSGKVTKDLSYRKQIARQLRTQYVEGIYDNPVTLKSRLKVTQGHWTQNHRVDHTWLTISRVIWRWIISWPFVKMFDAGKTRMIGLQYGEKTMTIRLSRYSTGTLRTDGRTDRYQYRASVWWRAIKTGAEMLRRSVIVWGNEFQT